LVLLDLYVGHSSLNPTVPRGTFERPSSVIDTLRGRPLPRLFVFDYGKIKGKVYTRRPAAPAVARFEDPFQQARVAHSYPRAPLARAWGVSGSYELELLGFGPSYLNALDLFARSQEETPGFLRLMQLASVHALLARHSQGLEDFVPLVAFGDELPQPVRVFGVPDPLPRAYAVGASRVETGLRAYETLVASSFDPRREVILSEGTPLTGARTFRSQTRLRAYNADRVGVQVEANAPGYVVVSDAFDPGWRATVDGLPVPLLRANIAFRAVPIPAGRHTVEMLYRPGAVSLGLAASVASVLATCIVALARLGRAPTSEPRGRHAASAGASRSQDLGRR
jgi:hypothetical protein